MFSLVIWYEFSFADSKLATIITQGKVANSATTATANNTFNTIVSRDVNGNFEAGIITASLAGNASSSTQLLNPRNIYGASFNGTADVANIIAEYEDFDDGRNVEYWKNEIRDYDEYKKTRRTGRENNPYMKYKIMPAGNGIVHHQEWYENGQQKTDCYYYYQSMKYHGNCKQWNEYGYLIYDRTFDRGDEKFMSKITGKGSKITLYKIPDEYDD